MREKFIRLLIDANEHRITECLSHEECYTCQNRGSYNGECQTPFMADYLIANDVVPVVRCKDCKHYENHRLKVFENCVRNERYIPMSPDDFCSYGERRTNNERENNV